VVEHYFSRSPVSRPERGLIRCHLHGHYFEFVTATGVFSHKRIDNGTRLLVESMILPEGGALLDVGCGYGPVGIAAARLRPGLDVWMTDVNHRAVSLARENVRRNGIRNARVLEGSLYEPVRNCTFDAIVTNPPFSAGVAKVVDPFVQGSVGHLGHGGSLQIVVRTTKGGSSVARLLERHFGGFEVVARGSGYRVLMSVKKGPSG
jgi:16S rRNA (guanine1207-N2)-methyltransferase